MTSTTHNAQTSEHRLPGSAESPVTYDDILAAAAAIDGAVARTPTAVSRTLSEVLGATVVLKFEIFQFTASYKERGARNRLSKLSRDERAAGVVAVSAGNHAQAIAYHAGLLDIPATIVMPRVTPFLKVARTKHLGAEVVLVGDSFDEALDYGLSRAADDGRVFVHAYDDPAVIAGQGTVALELTSDEPDIDTILVPVGGGGLIAGVLTATAQKALEVVGVQSALYPSMVRALAGDATPVPGGRTIAEGIAVGKAGSLTSQIVRAHSCPVLEVSEASIEHAVAMLIEIEKVVAEGAAAAAVAALLEHRDHFAGRTVGIILTGGNIDPRVLASVLERGLVHEGRLTRIRLLLDDRPGQLAQLLAVVSEAGGNVIDVQHQRAFMDGPVSSAEVILSYEAMDDKHRDSILSAVRQAGFRVRG
jgi:threonine dehydratase